MRFVVVALIAPLLVCHMAVSQSLPPLGGDDAPIKIDAEQIAYDQKNNVVTARGDVVIRRGDTELRADEVRVDRTTNEADAVGHVTVNDPEGIIYADSLRLNLEDETGALTGAAIQSHRLQYSLWGSQVEKGLGQSYRIENGRFTTCNCESGRQDWSISGKSLEVTLDGYGILKDGTFNVLDVPVLYLPRAILPIQRDRQSGFLIPRFGASNRRGFQTLLPFYWAISKSQDATIGFDLETSVRVGVLGRYRYALGPQSKGLLQASYFNEAFRGSASSGATISEIPRDRWSIAGEQRQETFEGGHAYTDLNLVGDDRFFRDINTYAFEHARAVSIRTQPFTATRLGVVQLWDHIAARTEGIYYQDLTDVDSQTLQAAPKVDVWGQNLLGWSLLGDVHAEGVDFQRARGVDGLRLDVSPGLTLPLPLERYGFGSVRVSARETAYALTDTKQEILQPGKPAELPSTSSRELITASAEAGTVFNRVYPFQHWGLERIKHTIEPGIQYLYVPAINQDDQPLFDGVDRVNHRNLVTYGMLSRVIGRFASDDDAVAARQSPIRELGRFSITQSYDVSREIKPLTLGSSGGDHFSDIDFAARVNPSRYLSLRFLSNYDTSTGDFSSARVSFYVEDPRRQNEDEEGHARRLDTRTSAGVSYRFLTNNLLQEVDTNIVVRLTDWAGLLYASRYNVVANRFLDNFVGLRLISSCDCWALDLAVTNRSNPNETEARAQITLLGLSSKRSRSRVAAMP